MTPFAARMSLLTASAALAGLLFAPAWAADEPKKAPPTPAEEAEQHVALAEKTFENFWLDPGQDSFRRRLSTAQGVLIIPISARIGFIFGGQGGRGVLVTRDASGKWGGPAFYTLTYASVGLQVGVQVSEVVILVMTQNAVNSLLSSSVRGGVDAALAGGPVGTGSQTSFQGDFLSFYRSKVAYAGLNINGNVLSSNDTWNAGFYGKPINTADILVRHEVSSPKGEGLVNQVSAAAAQSAEQQKTAAAEKPAPAKDEKK
ncbi:MAG TPA: lipid-binding SYLF domain-containing protein [Burkholderiales bacterium]|nr:lipid-binding SYLF domain-containing protein [Burkholderiales bacterium]